MIGFMRCRPLSYDSPANIHAGLRSPVHNHSGVACAV
jgi:hypothetical protein